MIPVVNAMDATAVWSWLFLGLLLAGVALIVVVLVRVLAAPGRDGDRHSGPATYDERRSALRRGPRGLGRDAGPGGGGAG